MSEEGGAVCEQCGKGVTDSNSIIYEFGEVRKDMCVCFICHEEIIRVTTNGTH